MIKNKKVQMLLDKSGAQSQNFTLVLRLKHKIQQLTSTLQNQKEIIEQFKKSIKNTTINQMEIQIQHLNDENKRLFYLLEQNKKHSAIKPLPLQKKMSSTNNKYQETKLSNDKYQQKYYKLKENQRFKKDLLNYKVKDSCSKKKKSMNNQRSMGIIKNQTQVQKIKQKNYDLQSQVLNYKKKIQYLQNKLKKVENNQSYIIKSD